MHGLADYHCLAPDLPGHGRSGRVPWASLVDTAEQVAGLIEDRVPSRRAHVVGLSLGGAVAHTILARHPKLLDRVVIDFRITYEKAIATERAVTGSESHNVRIADAGNGNNVDVADHVEC